jgi:SH3-like domain-containing protein
LRLPPPGLPPPPPPPLRLTPAPRAPVRQIGRPLPVVRAPARRHEAPPRAAAAPRPAAPPPHPAPRADIGSVTGLKLPRFASLRSDEVDLRAGPGFRYPIRWVYHRAGMPVEIEREFSVWREVLTPDGARGWMHEATLTGRRDGFVTASRATLVRAPAPTAQPVAEIETGVVVHILRCDAGAPWCRVTAGAFRGWLPRADFWGTFRGEAVHGP